MVAVRLVLSMVLVKSGHIDNASKFDGSSVVGCWRFAGSSTVIPNSCGGSAGLGHFDTSAIALVGLEVRLARALQLLGMRLAVARRCPPQHSYHLVCISVM